MTFFPRAWALSVVAAFLFMLAVSETASAQQTPDFGAPLAQLAGRVEKDIERVHTKFLLVIDFAESKGEPTALGHELACAFANSLRQQEHGFLVLDDSVMSDLARMDGLAPKDFKNRERMAYYGPDERAKIAIEGELQDSPDRVTLKIEVWKLQDRKEVIIFEESSDLAMTPEMQALLAKPAVSYVPSPADYSILSDVPRAGEKGYTSPQCIECPRARFTFSAVQDEISGDVILLSEINTMGVVNRIIVIRGLPDGLTDRAVKTVEKWKFEPASGPDGKPATVVMTIKMEFHSW